MTKFISFLLLIFSFSALPSSVSTNNTSDLTGSVFAIPCHIEAPINKIYHIYSSAKFTYTVNDITLKTDSGTITVALKIDGTNITSCNAISVTSSESTTTCTAANSVAIGEELTFVTTSNASADDLHCTIGATRNS